MKPVKAKLRKREGGMTRYSAQQRVVFTASTDMGEKSEARLCFYSSLRYLEVLFIYV